MRRTADARLGAGAAVLLLAVAACGSPQAVPEKSSPSAPSPTPSTASASATPSPTTSWVALHDRAAGVRFSLPHHVDPQSRPAQDPRVQARLYQDTVGDIGLSVSVVQGGAPISAASPRSVYAQMASALSQQGATNTHLSRVRKSTVAKGQALDATLTFTATDGSHNYWRMRTITAGRTLVQVQVLTFSDPGDAEAPRRVDAMFRRLAGSVTLE